MVPACYGLPEFRGTDFEDPIWQREEANKCQPPHKNEYIKDENGEDTNDLGRTYQIFWHGGHHDLDDLTAAAIKAGEGDFPGTADISPQKAVFWSAIPNELYTLTVRHDLYQFPNFYVSPEDEHLDDYGNLLGVPLEGLPEFNVDHYDMRDVYFDHIKDTASNLPKNGQAPYIPGCNCSQLKPFSEGGDGINNDPLADINLNYLAGIKGNSTNTQSITINSSEVKGLAFCSPTTHMRTIEFDPILPTTVFEVNNKFFTDWLTEKYGDAGGEENYNDWLNYIKEGQYSVFHVSLSPSSDPDHPNTDPNVGCHDQVGYSFAFALNLKDILKAGDNTEPDPKCYTGTSVKLTAKPPRTKLPKLYYTARTAGTEIEYPGELLVLNGNKVHVGEKQCIFLNGFNAYSTDETITPPSHLRLPTHLGDTSHWGIGMEDGDLLLSSKEIFGSHWGANGLTLLAEVLESNPRSTEIYKEESTLETIVNLHLELNDMNYANSVARGDLRGTWSHFGSDNPEQ